MENHHQAACGAATLGEADTVVEAAVEAIHRSQLPRLRPAHQQVLAMRVCLVPIIAVVVAAAAGDSTRMHVAVRVCRLSSNPERIFV